MHRAGHGGGGLAGLHELEQRHLGGGVLHGHPVGGEIDVGNAALVGLLHGAAGEVGVENFLGEGERAGHGGAGRLNAGAHAGVHRANHFQVESHRMLR